MKKAITVIKELKAQDDKENTIEKLGSLLFFLRFSVIFVKVIGIKKYYLTVVVLIHALAGFLTMIEFSFFKTGAFFSFMVVFILFFNLLVFLSIVGNE